MRPPLVSFRKLNSNLLIINVEISILQTLHLLKFKVKIKLKRIGSGKLKST